jgi:hypothetical protein
MRFLLYILLASFYIINPTQVNAGMLPLSQGKIVADKANEQSSIKKDKLSQKQFASLTAIPQTGINYSSYRYHPFEKFFFEEVQFGNYKLSNNKEFLETFGLSKPIGLLLIFPHHNFW